MTGPRRHGLLVLAFGLAVLLARLAVALAHQDTWYPFEIHSGTIARALLDGLELEVATLPIVPHARGSALFGFLLVPIYAVAGASSLTLKLLPVLWHAATVALLVGLLERYFTRRAAVCAGVLFLLAPPVIQKLATLGLASHLESMLPYLLTWGAYLAWTTDGPSRGRALRFGAALGFSAFFHLQALLPALIVLGMLVWHERRRLLSAAGLWLAAGFAACSAPAFLFRGGAIELLLSGVFTRPDASGREALGAGRLEKLAGLFGGDLASALDFGGAPASPAAWLGPLAALGLALGTLCGLLTLRRAPRAAAFFPLHALLVAGLYTVSELGVVDRVGSGATNRHLAPMVVSLLAFTAVGAARGRLALIPVALLTVVGALGYPAVVRSPDAARVRQRGEFYEWFAPQLSRLSQGEAAQFAALVERIDAGDARFRTLRFRLYSPQAGTQAGELLAGSPPGEVNSGASSEAARLYRWTAVGRELAGHMQELAGMLADGRLAGLAPLEREALLHGVGLGLQPPRPVAGLDRVAGFVAQLELWLVQLAPEDARALAEGYGFQLGLVFDPYNARMAEALALQAGLDPRFGVSVARGLAWGLRQRYLHAPVAVPEGYAVLGPLDPRVRPAFEQAFVGQTLPVEAQVFAR